MPRKRKRSRASFTGGRLSVIERIINMKAKCNFSAKQLKHIISLYEPEEADLILKIVNRELRQNYSAFRLHGCSQCDDFVWLAGENRDCDICHNQDGRSVPFFFYFVCV